MAEFLVIRLGKQSDDPVSWVVAGNDGSRRGAPCYGSLLEAAAETRDRALIVLVPGADVLTLHADIPAKGARLLAALPFALEDQLAEDIDQLHFAAGARVDTGRLPIAVVTRRKMDEWIAALRAAGLYPARLVPDYHGLALTPNTLSMMVAADGTLFNDGAETRMVLPEGGPAEALALTGILDASTSDDDLPRHLLVYCDAAIGDLYLRDWDFLRQDLSSVDVNLLPDGALPKLAVTVAAGAGINLLQGLYAEKTRLGNAFRPWRYAAMLGARLFLLALFGKGVDAYRLHAEHSELQAQFIAEYQRLKPGDTREIVDPAATVNSLRRSQVSTAGGPQLFLPSITSLAEAIRRNNEAEVEAVSYRAGVIDVRLTAPDIPTLDKIVQAIDSSGRFSASLQSADTVGELVNSRIQIREAGS
jgi:general secretion pathway protein L